MCRHRSDVLRAPDRRAGGGQRVSASRRPGSRARACLPARRSAPAASCRRSATSTTSTHTPGTSSTRRWRTRPSSAASIKTDGAAAPLAGADRPLPRAGQRSSAAARSFPGSDRGRNGIGSTALVRARRRRPRRRRELAPRRSPSCTTAPTIARTTTRTRGNGGDQRLHRHSAHLGAGRDLQVGARRQCAQHEPQAAGRVFPAQRKRHPDLRPATARRADRRAAATLPRSAAGTCRACTSSCRAGAWALRYDRLDSGTLQISLVSDGTLVPADFSILRRRGRRAAP